MNTSIIRSTICFLSAILMVALSSCRPSNLIHARVLDGATGTPMANVIVVGEKGGLYIDNPDKRLGNPSYVYGAVTDSDGVFVLPLERTLLVGLHTFFEGYRYGQTNVEGIGYAVTEITMGKQLAKDLPPTLRNATLSKNNVAPGEEITVTVVATAGTPADPMSEEVVIVEDSTGFGIAMAPPAPGGVPGAWPDGIWTATFPAPKTKGTYMFHIASTSEGCVNSNEIPWELTVQ